MAQHPTESLINYIVSQDPRRARRILYNAGYEVAQSDQQLKAQLFDYIQNDKGDALKNIMREHPDADYFKSANVLPHKAPFDKSFPLPTTMGGPSRGYYDQLTYNQNYPYTANNLTDHAVPLTYREGYWAGIQSGWVSFTGNSQNNDSKGWYLIVLILIGIFLLANKE